MTEPTEATVALADKAYFELLDRISRKPDIILSKQNTEERIFNEANGFYEGALRCLAPIVNDDGSTRSPMTPAIVNMAFAIELYLKSELHACGQPSTGHNLNVLFERLEIPFRNLVEQNYQKSTSRDAKALQNDIGEFSNAFVKWRYVYEQSTPIKIVFYRLAEFTRALYRAIRIIHPAWKINDSMAARLDQGADKNVIHVILFNTGVGFRIREK